MTQVAVFSETNNNTKLESRINDFLANLDDSSIISIKHRTVTNRYYSHTVTVMITYKRQK